MSLSTALILGRVSNLPTVWTNMLAGIVLAGGAAADWRILPLGLALTLFYVGGMYLNDAFDAPWDAGARADRPIPAGHVERRTVFVAGFAMLGGGLLMLTVLPGGTGPWPVIAGLGLAAAIVLYDAWHKTNPLSPVLMGLCRLLVYVVAGLAFTTALPAQLWIGALMLLAYLIGLTYAAKQETLDRVDRAWPLAFLAAPAVWGLVLIAGEPVTALFWIAFIAMVGVALWLIRRREPGDIGRAVGLMLAGICLFDAMLIAGAGAGAPGLAVLAAAGFPLTLALQRWVPGT
ncbi:MAG TPA: UbiA family prenyltransferase [Afifellaceae bacterium]|nr:UbiA family prenyltransferase [Afifellaceae bacterium]